MTTKADQVIDRAADRLRELAEDAAFIRKLKPSLIAARMKGEAPTDQPAGSAAPATPLRATPKPKPKRTGAGPSPLLIVGAAFVAGIVIAKVIDWRGHAHPRA